MYYVYILHSISHNKIYIGYTGNLKKRFDEYNKGFSRSTKGYLPWRLVYYEAYVCRDDAAKREAMLKAYPKTLGGLKRRLHKSLWRN